MPRKVRIRYKYSIIQYFLKSSSNTQCKIQNIQNDLYRKSLSAHLQWPSFPHTNFLKIPPEIFNSNLGVSECVCVYTCFHVYVCDSMTFSKHRHKSSVTFHPYIREVFPVPKLKVLKVLPCFLEHSCLESWVSRWEVCSFYDYQARDTTFQHTVWYRSQLSCF